MATTNTTFSAGRPAYCLSRRSVTVLLALGFSILCLFFLVSFGPKFSFSDVPTLSYLNSGFSGLGGGSGKIEDCSDHRDATSVDIWNSAKDKYDHLMDDKFTIAIQTYRRPKELNDTIHLLTDTKIPSLHEIVVVWNDLENPPPEDFTTGVGVGVRYRMSRKNSLNEKLWPDPSYATKAVLLSDDDVHYEPSDLDFVFQTWRKQGMNRITGAFARCVVESSPGVWKYDFCSKESDAYALVLTGLAFVHVSFMDYYSSADPVMEKVRVLVDERFNCEDIALNFVASMLTCQGPLQVRGREKAVNTAPPQGISTKPGHLEARHECVNDFVEMFGYMPLINTTEYTARGLLTG